MNKPSADLIELFSSVQGEGVLLGRRQVFLRLSGCNLACRYCDTSYDLKPFCRMETTPGHRDFIDVPNPVDISIVIDQLTNWKNSFPNLHHSISITGGEPLLHAELLFAWLPILRDIHPIFLETNGILTESLKKIIAHIDFVCMDIKIPSTSGHNDLWGAHREFLAISVQKETSVKVIVSIETDEAEIDKTCETIVAIDRNIPLIIQPVTEQIRYQDIGEKLLRLQERASCFLADVRVIPQLHTMINVL